MIVPISMARRASPTGCFCFSPTVRHHDEGHALPTGPDGGKRPAAVIANAVLSMRIATGEATETYLGNRRTGG